MSVSFNPGQREDVAAIKQIFADAFDEIDKWVRQRHIDMTSTTDPEVKENIERTFTSRDLQHSDMMRLASIAKTNLETAQMYAVKAVTR
jgi:hypothetical protein